LANLTLAIATINAWNRLAIAARHCSRAPINPPNGRPAGNEDDLKLKRPQGSDRLRALCGLPFN